MKIVILEFIDEAKLFLARFGRTFFDPKDTLVICLHPKVRVFLKENGIDSKGTVDYLGNDAQHRVILETEKLTSELMKMVRLRDSLGMQKGYENLCSHHLRMYISYFLSIIEILKSLKEKHPVSDAYCCTVKDEQQMYTEKAFIQENERFLGFLLRDFCGINRISLHEIEIKLKKTGLLDSFLGFPLHKAGELFNSIEYRFIAHQKLHNKETIVVPALSYNMGKVIKEIKKRHPGIKCIMVMEGLPTLRQRAFKILLLTRNWLDRVLKKSPLDGIIFLELIAGNSAKEIKQTGNFISAMDGLKAAILSQFKSSLSLDKVYFHSFLAGKIKGLTEELVLLQRNTTVLNNILKSIQPRLLMAMYGRGIYYNMGEISNSLGFPSLIISHGTHVPPNNEYERIENFHLGLGVILNTYKYVAVQTPWADKFLDYYKDNRPRIFSGPLIYSNRSENARTRIRNEVLGLKDSERVIVHATTQKLRNGMRFHIEETLDEYIASLTDIVKVVNDIQDIHLIVRPHPICDITKEEFIKLLPPVRRLSIMNKGPFSDILSVSDLLISYSSTCIEEALQNQIPVILFDKWRRYNHFNLKELSSLNEINRQPAYYVASPDVLKESLPKIIELTQRQPLKDADLKDFKYPDNFRMNFSNFINEVLGKERAAN